MKGRTKSRSAKKEIRIGLIGATGRMGITITRGLYEYGLPFKIASVYAKDREGEDLFVLAGIRSSRKLLVVGTLKEFLAVPLDVVLDFTGGQAVALNGPTVARKGIPYIIGSTGVDQRTLAVLKRAVKRTGSLVLLVPNFSLGATLMMTFSKRAAGFFSTAEVIERHHEGKKDSPSGTAIRTVEMILSKGDSLKDYPVVKETLPGARGALLGKVRIHSVRAPGYVAEQEVVFCDVGETLRIEHRSIQRESFLRGIIFALKNYHRFSGFLVGLESIMVETL